MLPSDNEGEKIWKPSNQKLWAFPASGWGGAANTNFWIDPKENLIGILMLQYMPIDTHPVVTDFRNLVYQALVD